MLEAPTPPLPPLFAAAGVGPERGARDRARVPAFTPAGTTAGATTARAGDSDGSGGIRDRLLPPAAAPAADPFGLSPREHEVLRVLAEGRTNREIAERLFISERTVDVHVRNILGKLGVAGRVEATSVALRLGLVTGLPGVAPVPRG
jgi:DNA-binding CsgD family transcriptional regulator